MVMKTLLLALFLCMFQSGLEAEMKTLLLVTRSNVYQLQIHAFRCNSNSHLMVNVKQGYCKDTTAFGEPSFSPFTLFLTGAFTARMELRCRTFYLTILILKFWDIFGMLLP